MRNTAISGGDAWRGAAVALALFSTAAPVQAHVFWTQVNSVHSTTLFLSHGDHATSTLLPAEPPLPVELGLTPTSATATITTSPDVVGSIFGPQSVTLTKDQTLQSTASLAGVSGDLTVEFWFKWLPDMTSSTLEFGLGSGARILVARNTADPAKDRFGVAAPHGSFRSAPGFVSWVATGDEYASLNIWRHIGLTIHSTGTVLDGITGQRVYGPGSTGRMYYYGHLMGIDPDTTIDLAGLPIQETSSVILRMAGAGMAVDELTIWSKDWSDNGLHNNPFGNGRGNAIIEDALDY